MDIGENELIRDMKLLRAMEMSLQPPHLIRSRQDNVTNFAPNAAFPFCFYGSQTGDDAEGDFVPDYQDYYCNAFETTFNDHGLCYTFNNVEQGLSESFRRYAQKCN